MVAGTVVADGVVAVVGVAAVVGGAPTVWVVLPQAPAVRARMTAAAAAPVRVKRCDVGMGRPPNLSRGGDVRPAP
jgi:hypothetical protein